MAHALLSASSASRWMACTRAPRLEANYPNSVSSYAEEGTVAHSLAEIINSYNAKHLTKAQCKKKLAAIESNPYYNAEMRGYIEIFCQYVWETYHAAKTISKDAVIALEERLDFSSYVPEGFGTGDVVIIADGVLSIIDLKYGQGVKVSAERNEQMMLYALGAFLEYDLLYGIRQIKTVIYQPRLDNISEWDYSAEELLDWAENVLKPRAALAWDGAGDYRPGDHCRFCRAKAVCRARAEENLKLAHYEFAAADTLTDDEIADILKTVDRLVNWASDIKNYALTQALKGVAYDGWKLVEGRSDRKITDPDAVAGLLEDAGYVPEQIFNAKLKGIGDLEKLLGKEGFMETVGSYVVKPPGKPTLAPASDNRPTWSRAAADFANVDVEDEALPF